MNQSEDLRTLEFRVGLLERAFSNASNQIRELTTALGDLARLSTGDQPSPGPISIEPDSVAPFSSGFYRREEDSTGRGFRWTGRGDHFELRLGLNRNLPWSFVMELRPNVHVQAALLRAFIDYVEVPIEADAAGRFVRGTVPVREFGSLATLTFFLPKTFKPSDSDANSKDSRTLGLAFYGLKLEPALAGAVDSLNGSEVLSSAAELQQQPST